MCRSKKYAVVTGCNRGLGLAAATRLANEGFTIIAVCRRLEDASKTSKKLGGGSVPFQLDLAKGEEVIQSVASRIMEWLGGACLDMLVNNAGNSYGAWDADAWTDSWAVNYKGPIVLTEALLPSFAEGASVSMVGSGLGDVSLISKKYVRMLSSAPDLEDLDRIANLPMNQLWNSWVGPYGFSKALLHRATELLAADSRYTAKHITLNAVCPGWVRTDMGGEQAPISVDEGAGHILEKALAADPSVTGTFTCYCYKNFDADHQQAWDESKQEDDTKWWSDSTHSEAKAATDPIRPNKSKCKKQKCT